MSDIKFTSNITLGNTCLRHLDENHKQHITMTFKIQIIATYDIRGQ
jgi:hypothetical protein